MIKFLKWAGVSVLALIGLLVLVIFLASEEKATGKEGHAAEALADKMLLALNVEAYDSLEELRWSFPRGHHFVWNKKEHTVNVRWSDFEVDLIPDKLEGTALKNGKEISGSEAAEAVDKAWSLFANDSFWLVAPYKVRDPGTTRELVTMEDGSEALLITYHTGGVTPGDSYLWILGDDFRPKSWKMWVSIIPIGGFHVTWEDWQQHAGAWFAPTHLGPGPVSVNLKNLNIR